MLPDNLFISGEIHEREVELADGTKYVMHFKEVAESAVRRYSADYTSVDEGTRDMAVARLISASLVDADGAPAMAAERAALLKPKVSNAIMRVVLEINGMTAELKAGKK